MLKNMIFSTQTHSTEVYYYMYCHILLCGHKVWEATCLFTLLSES